MKPFDLEKAKAGAPLVTRDGKPVKFIAHVPEAQEGCRVVFMYYDGTIGWRHENGLVAGSSNYQCDLFLADPPKVKKERYVFLYLKPTGEMDVNKFQSNESNAKGWSAAWNYKFLGGAVITWEEEAV